MGDLEVRRRDGPQNVDRRRHGRIAQRDGFGQFVDTQPIDVAFDRARHGDQAVSVGVGLDHRCDPRGRDEAAQGANIGPNRRQVDDQLGEHCRLGRPVRSAR